jgi:Raf kinase inhibitor-like YbhB/YbcL family protein
MTANSFVLRSTAFAEGEPIPVIHTAQGLDLSPPLHWQGEPEQTRSYALVLDDPDAPMGTWIHWLLYDIPASLHALPAGLERSPELANGARQGACWGVDVFERIGYQGPQPPAGQTHRFRFRLHALDTHLSLPAGSTVMQLQQKLEGHLLATAQLSGTYCLEPMAVS